MDYFLVTDRIVEKDENGNYSKLFEKVGAVIGREQYLISLDTGEVNKYSVFLNAVWGVEEEEFLRELLYELIWRFLDGVYDINYLQKLLCGINEVSSAFLVEW